MSRKSGYSSSPVISVSACSQEKGCNPDAAGTAEDPPAFSPRLSQPPAYPGVSCHPWEFSAPVAFITVCGQCSSTRCGVTSLGGSSLGRGKGTSGWNASPTTSGSPPSALDGRPGSTSPPRQTHSTASCSSTSCLHTAMLYTCSATISLRDLSLLMSSYHPLEGIFNGFSGLGSSCLPVAGTPEC